MSDTLAGYDEVRSVAHWLDGRFRKQREVTLARDVVESGVRSTLCKHFPHWELDDPSLPLFVQALAAVEATS